MFVLIVGSEIIEAIGCDSQFLVWEVKKIIKCNDEGDSILEDSRIRDFQNGYRRLTSLKY
jgi:hypothetical protein